MSRLMLVVNYNTQLEITPKLLAELEKCKAFDRQYDGNPRYQSTETILDIAYVSEKEFTYKEQEIIETATEPSTAIVEED